MLRLPLSLVSFGVVSSRCAERYLERSVALARSLLFRGAKLWLDGKIRDERSAPTLRSTTTPGHGLFHSVNKFSDVFLCWKLRYEKDKPSARKTYVRNETAGRGAVSNVRKSTGSPGRRQQPRLWRRHTVVPGEPVPDFPMFETSGHLFFFSSSRFVARRPILTT